MHSSLAWVRQQDLHWMTNTEPLQNLCTLHNIPIVYTDFHIQEWKRCYYTDSLEVETVLIIIITFKISFYKMGKVSSDGNVYYGRRGLSLVHRQCTSFVRV